MGALAGERDGKKALTVHAYALNYISEYQVFLEFFGGVLEGPPPGDLFFLLVNFSVHGQ